MPRQLDLPEGATDTGLNERPGYFALNCSISSRIRFFSNIAFLLSALSFRPGDVRKLATSENEGSLYT